MLMLLQDTTNADDVVMYNPKSIYEAYALIPLAREAHKESYFGDVPFEEDTFIKICDFTQKKSAHYGGIYGEYAGQPACFALYMLRPYAKESRLNITLIYAIYIRADLRGTRAGAYMWDRMLKIVRAWGIPRSSRGMTFNVTSGVAVEETDLLLRAAGAEFLGGNYFMPH